MRRFRSLLTFTLLTHSWAAQDVEVGDEEPIASPHEPAPNAYDMDDDLSMDEVSKYVNTGFLLPSFSDKNFPVGKPVTFLINFQNNGQEVLNISTVRGFLHSPFDLNYYIQNFSVAEVRGGMVGPKSHMSLDYQLMSDPTLEPLEFWLSGYVEYQAEGSDTLYRSTFFNDTVTLVNTSSSKDLTIIFSTLVLIAGFVGVIYGLMKTTKKGAKAKKKFAPKAPVSEAEKAVAAASWETPVYERSGPKKMRK